jgi:hypothetical protein
MTPFEIELLKTAWPYLWTGMLGVAGWFIRNQANRLGAISASLNTFAEDVDRIEKEMLVDRAENRHRLDRLIAASDVRLSRIETGCEAQHGIVTLGRRSTDAIKQNWAHDSDISGCPKKCTD